MYAQAYFAYDSKKSGSQTVSHLRFGPDPINSSYLVQSANFIGCHQFDFVYSTDILARGDFESEGLFGTIDRAFIRNERVELVDAESRALRLDVPGAATVRTGMSYFDRVFTPSNPTTFTGRMRATTDVEIDVILQRRRLEESLDQGLTNDTARVVGRIQVPAGGWKSFSVDFDQPRVSTRSVRMLIDVAEDPYVPGGAEVAFDDLAWVEWHTPWMDRGVASFATHVQFRPQP